jgi:hypothetical protein
MDHVSKAVLRLANPAKFKIGEDIQMAATTSQVQRHATYEDANLLLRLYELRREEKLRKARDWFIRNFHASTEEEFKKICPLGSEENAFYRMVVSYWDMAASFVTGGVLHQELFTGNSRELLLVWERIRDIVPAVRESFQNPNLARNLETVANTMIADRLPEAAFGVQ